MTKAQALTKELETKGSKAVEPKESPYKNILARLGEEAGKIIHDEKMVVAIKSAMFNELRKNQKLFQVALANPDSFLIAVYNAVKLDIPIGDVNGLCHLIPYDYNGRTQVEFQLNYKGYLELLRRTGEVKNIYSYCVYKGDEFSYTLGLHRDIKHIPKTDNKKGDTEITHCYAVVEFHNGGTAFDCLSREEIENIKENSSRKNSQGKYSPAWENYYSEMAKKTVIKRLLKTLPVSSEDLRKVVEIENMADDGKDQEFIDEGIQGNKVEIGVITKGNEINASDIFEPHPKKAEVVEFKTGKGQEEDIFA